MKRVMQYLTFPLLVKELTEQAMRKRTYVLRTLYALMLFSLSALLFHNIFNYANDPFAILGSGRQILMFIIGIQFFGIYVFLPILMAGAIAQEKENRTITLLMLTDLRPWEIILQKYFSRLIPMFTFLLLSLPLLAIGYALGGITISEMASTIWLLLLTCLQVGAFCLLVSAFSRSTANAFISSYILGLVFYFGPVLVFSISMALFINNVRVGENVFLTLLSHVPPVIYAKHNALRWTGSPQLLSLFLDTIPIMITTIICLFLARYFLVKRAMLSPHNMLLGIFKTLDRFFNKINQATTGGIILIKDTSSLPGDRPIEWLEISTRSLGKFRYLFRILIVTTVPVLFISSAMLFISSRQGQADALSVLLCVILWPLSVLLVSVQASGCIAGERSRQTLDILLSTPMTGREIILQKAAASRRLFAVLTVPMAIIIVTEMWWERHFQTLSMVIENWTYFVGSVLSLLIYLWLTAWLAMLIGMVIRRQIRAIITTLLVVIVWTSGPWLLFFSLVEFSNYQLRDVDMGLFAVFSPASFVAINEFNEFHYYGLTSEMFLIVNFLFYGGVTLLIRSICLRNADRLLGRA